MELKEAQQITDDFERGLINLEDNVIEMQHKWEEFRRLFLEKFGGDKDG